MNNTHSDTYGINGVYTSGLGGFGYNPSLGFSEALNQYFLAERTKSIERVHDQKAIEYCSLNCGEYQIMGDGGII